MKQLFCLSVLALFFTNAVAQSTLTIPQIMQGQDFTGYWPSNARWSEDSKTIYFNWNPEKNPADSIYKYVIGSPAPVKVSLEEKRGLPSEGEYNQARTKKVFEKNGDIFLLDIKGGLTMQLFNTVDRETSPYFGPGEKSIHFVSGVNLMAWDISTGAITQLTDFKTGSGKKEKKPDGQNEWLKQDQLAMFEILKKNAEEEKLEKAIKKASEPVRPTPIWLDGKDVSGQRMSPAGNIISYTLSKPVENNSNTMVPEFVNDLGYTEAISTRTKVGSELSSREVWLFVPATGKTVKVRTYDLPGIKDKPDFYSDYTKLAEKPEEERDVFSFGPYWSADGTYSVMVHRSLDNKDRWITLLNTEDGSNTLLDRQRDEAWVGGPGVGSLFSAGSLGWLADNKRIWFQSEETGYSHLYVLDVESKTKKALTSGKFEVYDVSLSNDKKSWYFSSNEGDAGQRHFYRLPLEGGTATKITTMAGSNDVTLSPDEKQLAVLYSFANKPWELHVLANKAGSEARKITTSTTQQFNGYNWREPQFVTFTARDGAQVPARLYKPTNTVANGPAVIFVHGAGYLQNAHKWWSSYFREYMFHNFLVDQGYTVLDIDYRASAGYGRDWRTAIYRHMGGWDLRDNVDGAKYLVEQHGVGKEKIGIYGGSYGGFITLMALFTEPEVFAAGAGLRSVTDWAHYNHPYTSNILNTPVLDSLAYRRSSPIYYAENLSKPLLIAHGMVDTNVHFQDVVRLAQRLIELGKEDWEMAVYPVENHGFVQPSSWTDEYRRIFELFERELK